MDYHVESITTARMTSDDDALDMAAVDLLDDPIEMTWISMKKSRRQRSRLSPRSPA